MPSIIAEVGGNGIWDEASVDEMTAGIDRVLHHLGMAGPAVQAPPAEPPRVVTMWVPAATIDGLWYPLRQLGEPVRAEGMTPLVPS